MVKKVFNIFSVSPPPPPTVGKKESQDGTTPAGLGPTTPFEQAIGMAGYGKFHHMLLVVCGIAIMGAIMEMISVGYVLPAAEKDFGLTLVDKGLLGAITYIGIVCSAHMWGVLADTTGRRRIMIRTLLADFVCAVLVSLAPNFWTLVLFRFCNGFCVSAPAALAYAYLGEFNTPKNRNRAIILVGLITGCSALILPGVAWGVLPMEWTLPLWGDGLEFKSWRLFVILGGVPSLLSGLALTWFPESPKFLVAMGRREEALQVLRRVYSTNTGRPGEDFPVRELTEDTSSYMAGRSDRSLLTLMKIVWNQTAPLFKSPFLLHTCLVCFIQFGNIASASGLLMWLPELFNRQAKYGDQHGDAAVTMCEAVTGLNNTEVGGGPAIKTQVYVNALIIGAVNVVTPIFGSLVVNKVGKRNLLIFCMAVTGTAAILLNFVRPYEAILALACVVIALTGMCIAHISSIVVDLFPTNLRAMAVSLSLMCGRLGSMAGNFIFGSLLESYCDASFYFFGGVLVLCGVCGCILPKKGKYAN